MDLQDDEAPKDPGAQKLGPYNETDFEGHRVHSVFSGVHIPVQRRHSSHRRHKHHHRNSESGLSESDRPCTPPAQRVQFILGEEIDDGTQIHPLFTEMLELFGEGEDLEWKETARWIKFEEDVEEGGNRWSKPHVGTLSLHSLFELRSLILNGTVLLDMEATAVEQLTDLLVENMTNSGTLSSENKEQFREVVLRKRRHLHQRKKHGLPIIRSLAEIGKNHSGSKNGCFAFRSRRPRREAKVSSSGVHNIVSMESAKTNGNYISVPVDEQHFNELGKQTDFGKFLTIPGGGQEKSSSEDSVNKSASTLPISRTHSSSNLDGSNGDIPQHNTHFMRKIPPGAEASNILVGEVDFLEKSIAAFIRLNTATVMGDLTEVPVPTRFVFLLITPAKSAIGYQEIGRAIATLMSDEVFHEVAYRAKERSHLLAGIDEFLDAVTVLPPGEWDPAIRIEPPAAIPSQDLRKRPPEKNPAEEIDELEEEQKQREESGLERSGRLFGGLMNDLKRKAPFYWSDFKDAVSLQCIASWIFLYFACLSPIITFGGLLSEATGKNMAAMESLVSGFVCGIGYGFFSGQPLTILGSTGPVLVFETIVYDFCMSIGWDYLSFRMCIGTWISIILIFLVAIDASALVCYITRFTEENFATLIAFIFIYKAVENVLLIGKKFPINPTGLNNLSYECECFANSTIQNEYPEITNWSLLNKTTCVEYNGTLMGIGCDTPQYVPDVFLMSIVLFLGTFLISIQLKDFKNALFFPSKVRAFISDFAVIIAIMSMTALDIYIGISTPKLEVPNEIKPTLSTRGWLVSPFKNPMYQILLAFLPALLGTILIFMDQQITSVIINRKEHKLKKGCGYHLDLFVLAILIQICSIMGLPWFVAATVLSINHVNSLKQESECAAPGEKPQFLGVREQRVTHILIFLTIGLSVFLTPMLRYIPMPVLFGVFLYMGVASLKGLQFFDRILIMFMPTKYQPDYMFLRQVPLRRVHFFTLIQVACLVCLWLIKSFSTTSILFPLMLVVMIGIRKSLDFMFTRREMKILDDVMPEMTKRGELDLMDAENTKQPLEIENERNLKISLANGNIMNIPLSAMNISEEVNKSGIWKQVNQFNIKEKKEKNKDKESKSKIKSPNKSSGRFKKKKSIKNKEEVTTPKRKRLEKRLSTMDEEDEDSQGIIIKCDYSGRRQTWTSETGKLISSRSETCV